MKAALETAGQFRGASEPDRKMVEALIDRVQVYDPEHVEIRWKFSDEVMKVMKDD